MIGDLPPHGNIYAKDKKICISPLDDTEYPNEDQEVIPDTSEHVDEKSEVEISVVQEDMGHNLVSYIQIFNLNVKSSTPRSKLMGSFILKHPL